MSQAHQTFTGESPEAPPVTGDQTDSPEFTDSDMEFTNPFLLGSGESAMNASNTVGPTGPSATDLQGSPPETTGPDTATINTGTSPMNPNANAQFPQSYNAGGEADATFWETKIVTEAELRTTPTRASADELSRMSGRGLALYLESLHVQPRSIGLVIEICSDGQEWINLINEAAAGGNAGGLAFLQYELQITSNLTNMKLLSDVRRAVQWEISALQERQHQRIIETKEADRCISPKLSQNQAEPTRERKHSGDQPRVHYAPKLPEYDPRADQGAGADALQMFGKSLSGWIEGFDSEMAFMVTTVLERVDRGKLELILTNLSEKSQRLDTQLGAHLFSTASVQIQGERCLRTGHGNSKDGRAAW